MKYHGSGEDGLDDLFRQNISEYRVDPSPGVWKGISRKLFWHDLVRFNFSNITPKNWSLIAVTAIVTGVAAYLLFPGEKPVASNHSATAPAAYKVVKMNAAPIHDKDQTQLVSSSGEPVPAANTTKTVSADPHSIARVNSEPASIKTNRSALPVKPAGTVTTILPGGGDEPAGNDDFHTVAGLNRLSDISYITPLDAVQFPIDLPADSIIIIRTARGDEKFEFDKRSAPRMISGSLGILPEMAFYNDPENYSQMNFWVHGGVSWHISRFSIGSGLELGYMLDKGKYRVDYKSLDSVGYYNSVVSFSTGANNEIIYNTSVQTLFDSLYHSDDYRTSNRYTYLRIPLLFGYRIVESDWFSATVKIGPAFSLLLGTKKGDEAVEYANARIIRIDEETPERLKTNWQLWANLNLEFRLNRRFSLYLEPSWKYFMKPTAEQENPGATPPWSAGIGLGVQINFDSKK